MHSGKVDDFLFHMTYKRFRATLREFAESDGINSEFVDTVLERYLANPGALGNILAQYTDRQAELRVGCLLRASKEVHKEITEHFESNREETPKALIHEMPSDKYLRLKLQSEYIIRYVRGIDEDELPKFREATLFRDKLLEGIKQVEQLKIDREEIGQQIQAVVKDEVASRSIEINRLNHEMELQQNEIKRVGDKVEAIRTGTASLEELEATKDLLRQEVQDSDATFRQLIEQLREKPSRLEVEDLRSRLADHREAVDEWKRQQKIFSDQLQRLEGRVELATANATSSHEDVERIFQSLLAGAKEDLERRVRAQLDGAKKETDEHRERIKQEVARLSSRMDSFRSENEWIDEIDRLLEEKLRDRSVPTGQLRSVTETIDNLKAEIERLSAQNGHDPKAHEQIDVLMTSLASFRAQFSVLEQKISLLSDEDVRKEPEIWVLQIVKMLDQVEEKIRYAKGKGLDLGETIESLREAGHSATFLDITKVLWGKVGRRGWLRRR